MKVPAEAWEDVISVYVIRGREFEAQALVPALYVAATPIGNLGDITIRALEALAACDLIACEDTRVTAKLLRHYGIRNKTVTYNEHNADVSGPELIRKIKAGLSVVLVSDAGTPLVSDPGQRLVESARKQGIGIIPLPGPSAPLTALVSSGLPAASWTFAGFLPNRREARKRALERCRAAADTAVFFESPNRLISTLEDLGSVLGCSRRISVARELTKMHEEIVTGSVDEVLKHFSDGNIRGEIVLMIAPAQEQAAMDTDQILRELMTRMPVSRAAAEAAELTGLSKRELYRKALSLRDGE